MSNAVGIRSVPVVADVAGWTSQGCFLDNLAPYQLFPTINTTSNSLTPNSCATLCAAYTYFGLENGNLLRFMYCYLTDSWRGHLLLRKRPKCCTLQLSRLAFLLWRQTCLSFGMHTTLCRRSKLWMRKRSCPQPLYRRRSCSKSKPDRSGASQ